ncbi:MAG: hypothetical protein KAS63_01840 [Candidatus Heimdallarchaeota archaeon]|nr:hypothetical protein [Candidatus Heimdallarchaeota archaeon]MCK4954076.1 hypothetical protein [Candidatus Heimdallarchaeota archaeon]
MSSDIIDIGIGPLTEDQLEDLASTIEDKINAQISKHPQKQLLTDYNFIVQLSQSTDNLLTLVIDFEMSGGLTSTELEELLKNLNDFAQDVLKEELLCLKKS